MTAISHIASAVVATTGELLEYSINTPGEISRAYKDVEAHLEAYRLIKNTLLNSSMRLMEQQDKGK